MKTDLIISGMKQSHVKQIKLIESEQGLSPWTEEDYRKECERDGSVSLVIEEENGQNDPRLVGFAVSRLIMKPNSTRQAEDGNTRETTSPEIAEIYNIGVRKSFCRMGIGSLLIENLLKIYRKSKIDAVWLELRESNVGAARFYQKQGFKREYVRKMFYSRPKENALVMKLNLMTRVGKRQHRSTTE